MYHHVHSIATVTGHELERVEEEDEEQLAVEEEERGHRRDELTRPRTPEPTGLGMDDEDDKARSRSRSPSPPPSTTTQGAPQLISLPLNALRRLPPPPATFSNERGLGPFASLNSLPRSSTPRKSLFHIPNDDNKKNIHLITLSVFFRIHPHRTHA
jgi:hypothetical protein